MRLGLGPGLVTLNCRLDHLARQVSSSFDELANDLRDLADMPAMKGFRIAYENWCWATHAPLWSQVWDIVQRVDRPNIGLCLDTFQTGGGEWGDPTTKSGKLKTMNAKELDRKFRKSLELLRATVPLEKIFLQVSDACKVDPPLDKEPDKQGLRPRGRWSHIGHCHTTVGMPVTEVTKAVLGTGFRGWFRWPGAQEISRWALTRGRQCRVWKDC